MYYFHFPPETESRGRKNLLRQGEAAPPLQTDHPDLQAAISRILAACHAAGKEALIFAGRKEDEERYFAQGFDSVALGLDAMILLDAYRNLLK